MLLPPILIPFENIIKEAELKLDKTDSGLKQIKIEIIFINDTILFSNEVIVEENTYFKYSYHWQTFDNQMIIRWDNAPHHAEISTFPHHKHIGMDENVHPSVENNLHDVLLFISQSIIT